MVTALFSPTLLNRKSHQSKGPLHFSPAIPVGRGWGARIQMAGALHRCLPTSSTSHFVYSHFVYRLLPFCLLPFCQLIFFFFKNHQFNYFLGNVYSILDQLANLHFHFTSVPRCTPMVWRYNGTPMEILHLIAYKLKIISSEM